MALLSFLGSNAAGTSDSHPRWYPTLRRYLSLAEDNQSTILSCSPSKRGPAGCVMRCPALNEYANFIANMTGGVWMPSILPVYRRVVMRIVARLEGSG